MSDQDDKASFTKWLREPQTMIGLAAILLSVCGLFISLYEASIMRENQRASVWPHVLVGPSLSSSGSSSSIEVFAENAGVGPAKIEAAELTYKGKTIQTWADLIKNIGSNIDDISSSISLINGRVLPANSDRVRILSLDADSSEIEDRKIIRDITRQILNANINVRICYCSVFDKCWITSLENTIQQYTQSSTQTDNARVVDSCKELANSGI